ncbi:unknown [Acidaminococcus intestini CAG:325]|nr:unknown [Acidaminococcus intestini CAG:325]
MGFIFINLKIRVTSNAERYRIKDAQSFEELPAVCHDEVFQENEGFFIPRPLHRDDTGQDARHLNKGDLTDVLGIPQFKGDIKGLIGKKRKGP